MQKKRVIYQVEGVYAGPTPATGKHFESATYGVTPDDGTAYVGANLISGLFRVQSANYGFNIARTDVNQYGELAAIDRIVLEQPTVNLELTYLLANVQNEKTLGLTITNDSIGPTSAIAGLLTKTTDEKNYFIVTAAEGNDLVGESVTETYTNPVIGIGNAFFSSYQFQASVGNFPTATVRLEALNIDFLGSGTGVPIPAVFPTDGTKVQGWWFRIPQLTENPGGQTINQSNNSLSVLRPGDVNLFLDNFTNVEGGPDVTDLKVQSVTVGFDLNRESLQKLGSKYAYSKEPRFPVNATLSVNALIGDAVSGSLARAISANTTFNPYVNIYAPGTTTVVAGFGLRGAKLDSQQYTSSIGPNKAVTLNFTSQVGGPQDTARGIFISGKYL